MTADFCISRSYSRVPLFAFSSSLFLGRSLTDYSYVCLFPREDIRPTTFQRESANGSLPLTPKGGPPLPRFPKGLPLFFFHFLLDRPFFGFIFPDVKSPPRFTQVPPFLAAPSDPGLYRHHIFYVHICISHFFQSDQISFADFRAFAGACYRLRIYSFPDTLPPTGLALS